MKTSFQHNSWDNFISQYGTHFIFDVYMGGRVVEEMVFTRESVATLEALNVDIEIAAKASYAKANGDLSFNYDRYSLDESYAESFASSINEFYIGGTPTINKENGTDLD